MIRLGVIGCGRVTSMFHLKAIKQIPELAITAVSDIDEARMIETKYEAGADNAYPDCDKLFDDSNVDAVVINTPPRFHEELTLDALGHGKHVLCEKPLAKTVDGCLRIRDNQNGLVVLPAHNYSFSPSLIMMEKYIAENDLGSITGVKIAFENNLKLYRSRTGFRQNNNYGVVDDVFPHILSILYPLTGHISDVESVNWWCQDYEVCDNMETKLIAGSVPVEANLSWTKLIPQLGVTVFFENGHLFTDLMMSPYKVDVFMNGGHEVLTEKGLGWYLDLIQFKHPSFKNQYQHFYNIITEGVTPRISIDDEVNMLETMDRVKEKMS